jgi:hypothetical protein
MPPDEKRIENERIREKTKIDCKDLFLSFLFLIKKGQLIMKIDLLRSLTVSKMTNESHFHSGSVL